MQFFNSVLSKLRQLSLIGRITIGLILGIILALAFPQFGLLAFFGYLFVGALKAVAPVIVFVLVCSSLAHHNQESKSSVGKVVFLYIIGMLLAGAVSVGMNYLFHPTLVLGEGFESETVAPRSLYDVLGGMVVNLVDNPVNAVSSANYMGILVWAITLGFVLRSASESSKLFLSDLAEALTKVITWIINLAPLGVMGLVFKAISECGLEALAVYGKLIMVLVGTMAIVALIVNPLIVWCKLRRNPYPLVFKCLRDSGIPAFFTRSSAANIPVNMGLCEELKLDKSTYSVSIPLGATINMAGAACTISILTLATANTFDIQVNFITSLLLCIVSALSACGTSGVAGGSLLLIPLSCSLFGIHSAIAMQVVGIGFIIGIVQDSCETALNSSTDVLFTAAVDLAEQGQTQS
ncbi:MAG: serine/threonine transporter SstT [Candidatus Bruticola sp.]